MDLQLMAALSNADAIASNEGEVRTIFARLSKACRSKSSN